MYGIFNLSYLICIRVLTLYSVLNNLNTCLILLYHYTIMYILLERLLVHYTCTLTHVITQRHKNVCNYIDYIAFIVCYNFVIMCLPNSFGVSQYLHCN